MAVELTLQNGRWSGGALRKFLEAWAPQSPLSLVTWAPWAATGAGLRTWVFAEGSIRGVHIVRRLSLMKGASITVRLNALAGRSDWIVAYAFLRGLLRGRGGRVLGPDGRVMRPEHLTDEQAAGDAQARLFEDAQAVATGLRGGERYALFPNPEFDLLLTQAMLPQVEDPARFASLMAEQLRDMAGRYQRATVVREGTLPNGRTLAIWSLDNALLPWADFIGIRRGPEAEDGVVLDARSAMDLLGQRLEVADVSLDRFFLAAIDPAEAADRELARHLLSQGVPIAEFMARYQNAGGQNAGGQNAGGQDA